MTKTVIETTLLEGTLRRAKTVVDDLERYLQITEAEPVIQDEPAGPSIDAVRAKVGDAIIKTSAETVHEIFKNYGIARVSDFRPEQYENLIEALDELIEGATNETDA
jgi:hypothetical protein